MGSRFFTSRWMVALVGLCLVLMKFFMDAFMIFHGGGSYTTLVSSDFSIHGEELEQIDSTLLPRLFVSHNANTFVAESVRPLEANARSMGITYVHESPPKSQVIYGGSQESLEANRGLHVGKDPVLDIIHILKGPTGTCRKLVRAGGELACRNSSVKYPQMDGQKYICLDREMQVITGSRNPQDCLVLSFGVHLDISFDIAARDMNCEVLMFDILPFIHEIVYEDEYVKFFQAGLSYERYIGFFPWRNTTTYYNTLEGMAVEYGFSNRLINLLKIDIEGSEWKVLRSLARTPFLDIIGQIAVEVHGLAFQKWLNETSEKEYDQTIKETFDVLQERGFERVSYFDNFLSNKKTFAKTNLSIYEAGELLMVNSNWYNKHFREKTSQEGLNFQPLSTNCRGKLNIKH